MPQELLMDLQLPNPSNVCRCGRASHHPAGVAGAAGAAAARLSHRMPAVIDFESFFNWQPTMLASWRGVDVGVGKGVQAGLFVFAFDKLFACKVNDGAGQ